MSMVVQIIERKGHLMQLSNPELAEAVPAGRTIRIDPQLFAPSSKLSDCTFGDPKFDAGDPRPPVAPTSVNLSSGFELEEIITDTTSPNFGCFLAQNITDHPQELYWQAICDLSLLQKTKPTTPTADLLQLSAGENGEYRGSAFGVNPHAIQGTAVTVLAATQTLWIEDINNHLIVFTGPSPFNLQLPVMGLEQDGMEVSFKNEISAGRPFIVRANGDQLIEDGGPNWQFPDPANVGFGFAITFVYKAFNETQGQWLIKTHYHDQNPLT